MVVKYMTLVREDGKIYIKTWIQIERRGKKPITIWRRSHGIGGTNGK